MLKNLKISSKILTAIFIPITLLIAVSIGVYIYSNKVIENFEWVIHTEEVIAKVESLEIHLVDMETGERGFLFSGKEEFLEPYKHGKEMFSKEISLLLVLVNDNPTQVTNLNKLSELQSAWDININQHRIQWRKDIINGNGGIDSLVTEFNKALGKQKMDVMRKKIDEIITIEKKLNVTRIADAKNASSFLILFTIAATVLAIIISLIVGLYIAKLISNPIKKLVTMSKRLSLGDLDFNVDIDSKDELGVLSEAFITFKKALKLVITDTLELTEAADEGKLFTRADSSNHNGDFAKIID